MDREIKFRAWDDLNKKWLMGYEYKNLGGFSLTGESVLFGEWGNCFDQFLFNKDGKRQEHLIIEQYTGLKDKNGVNIYEGDILMHTGTNQCDLEVHFKDGAFFGKGIFTDCVMDMYLKAYDYQSIEVIGNIHENPELIK